VGPTCQRRVGVRGELAGRLGLDGPVAGLGRAEKRKDRSGWAEKEKRGEGWLFCFFFFFNSFSLIYFSNFYSKSFQKF
jgi:hypothetical protein